MYPLIRFRESESDVKGEKASKRDQIFHLV